MLSREPLAVRVARVRVWQAMVDFLAPDSSATEAAGEKVLRRIRRGIAEYDEALRETRRGRK